MISIITPVYNAAPYLVGCLESIIAQSEKDWEAILIDDGSTDESLSICSIYAKKDPRFRLFSQKNGGASSARNTGLSKIRGDWVYFVDADDTLPKDALKIILQNVNKEGCDLTIGGYEVYNQEQSKSYWIEERVSEVLNRDQALSLMYHPKYYRYLGFICSKLFLSSIIQEHHLSFNPNIHFNEDRLFITQYMAYCSHVMFFTEPVYNYFERPSSAMSSINKGFNTKFTTDLDAMILMKQTITEISPQNRYFAYDGIASSYRRIKRMMHQFHFRSLPLSWSLRCKVLRNLPIHLYLMLIVKPAVGDLLRNIKLR